MKLRIASLLFCMGLAWVSMPLSGHGSDLPGGHSGARPLQSASELDYPPFAVVLPDGSADGFSVELLKAVVQAMGLKIEVTVGPWHHIKRKLIQGELDVLPLVSYSRERDREMDFSASYLRLHGTVFVRKGDTSIQSEADLKGREVLVMKGDNAHEYAVQNRLTDALILTENYEEALTLLSSGRHDAVLMLQLVGFQLLEKLNINNVVSIGSIEETNLKPVAKPLSGYEQKFCFAVPEGHKELLAILNEGLGIVIANGIYNEIYDRWFGPILPQPSVSWARIAKYLVSILVPLLLLTAALGLWYLKREIARKTRDLRKEIEERKLTELTLQKSETKFRTLFHVAAIPLCYVNQEGAIVDVNLKFTQVFGYTQSDIPGLADWWTKAYPDQRYRQWVMDTWEKAVQEAREAKTNISPIEYRVTCKSGEVKAVIISGTALQDDFLATLIDLTERLKMEEILKKTLADLERSNAELQQFAYVASHDLQEPLRAAVGFLQLIESRYTGQLDEKGHHYIERAVAAGHRMQGLINDLLSLSRVNTQALVLERTDLNEIVQAVLENLNPVIQEKQAGISCAPLPTLRVDRNQMVSLFQNLLANALKYNHDQSPEIKIGYEDEGESCRFYVRDNGIGIDPQFHDRIFMIFQRLHTRQEYSGTGIGLALCKKIVERHNGSIRVESRKGEGATFSFILPKERSVE
jgi:PAS domain S-box-containing protein